MLNEYKVNVSFTTGLAIYNKTKTIRAKTEPAAKFEAMSAFAGPRVRDLKAELISATPCFD